MVDYFIYDLATNAEFTEFVTGYRNRIEIAQSITLSNLVPNTTYYFRIAYIKNGIKTPYSNAVLTTDAIPTTITNTATSITPTSFRANFNSVADADSYEVDLLNSSNVVLDTVPTTNNYYDFTDLSNLTLYKYRVRVVIEGYESANSNLTEITTLSGIPDVPTNLVTSSITSTGFTATWDLVDGATSYDISINDGVAINVLTNTYNATGLSSGLTHTWKVRSKNAGSNSDYTANQSVLLIPATPTGLAVLTYTNTTASIIWNSSTGATSYKLYIKLAGTPIAGYNGKVITGTSESVTGLSENTTYTIEVLATNASGDSALSGSVSFKTKIKIFLVESNSITRSYLYTTSDFTSFTKLTSNNSYTEDGQAKIRNDGQKIAYARNTATGKYHVFVYDIATNTETQLTTGAVNDYEYCSWNPQDDNHIYCVKNAVTSSSKIVKININTLVESDCYATANIADLNFSPDGNEVIFRHGSSGIYRFRFSDWTVLNAPLINNSPFAVAGGFYNRLNTDILFSALVGGQFDLYRADISTPSTKVLISNTTGNEFVTTQDESTGEIYYTLNNAGDAEAWKLSADYITKTKVYDSSGNRDVIKDVCVVQF